MPIEILKGQKGNTLLHDEGYFYCFHSKKNNITRWRCQHRNCNGAIFTTEDYLIAKTSPHNHDADFKKLEILKIANTIKEKAAETKERGRDIIIESLKNCTDETIHNLPKLSSIRDNILRIRNNKEIRVLDTEDDIPSILHRDFQGNLFFRYDSGVINAERIVVFISELKKSFIEKIDIWLLDGTFRTAPNGFYQLLTIHGYFLGKAFPVFYIILNSKTQNIYIKAFEYIKRTFNFYPKYVISDFEKAILNSIQICFPECDLFACYFHFAQSISRWIRENGYISIYKSNQFFKTAINYIVNLAFVPETALRCYYRHIKNWINENEISMPQNFYLYFEKVYFGNPDEDTFNSVFHPKLWNVYTRVKKNIPRTNNMVEGWHRSFNKINSVSHPNLARLINILKEEEELDRFKITKCLNGEFENNKTDLKKEERIRLCVSNFSFFDGLNYLKIINTIYSLSFD